MKRRALAGKNRPRSIGLTFYAVVWLLLDRFDPPGWVWGVVATLCAIILALSLWDIFSAEDVELPRDIK
jgi:hypothetical protein